MKFYIKEKSDDISWDVLAELQYNAHADNRNNGIDQSCSHMNGYQLQKSVGDGRCFVAISENIVVGMVCYKIVDNYKRYWFCNGERTAELLYTAVLPEYQKGGLFFKLVMTRNAAIEEDGATLIVTDTHFKNHKMRDIFKLYGYKEVCLFKYSSCNYYSVVYANWLKPCPYSEQYIKFKFLSSFVFIQTLYKNNGQYRLFFNILRTIKNTVLRYMKKP